MEFNMKRTVGIACIMIMASVLFVMGQAPKAEAKMELVWSTMENEKGPSAVTWKAMNEDLKKATNGEVTIKIYYSQALGKAREHYEMVLKGVADMCSFAAGYTPGRFPISELPSFGISPSGAVSSAAMAKLAEAGYLDKEYSKVKIIWVAGSDAFDLLWRKGVKAATTLEELKGRKIRVGTTGAANLLKTLGASPIGMPMPEVYTSMERGVIDGVLTNVNVYDVFGISNISNEITRLGMPAMSFTVAMNKKTWEKLPPEAKAVFEKNLAKYSVMAGKKFDSLSKRAIERHKPKFYDPSPGVKKTAFDTISKELNAYVGKYEKEGFPIRDAAKLYYETVKEMSGVAPFSLP